MNEQEIHEPQKNVIENYLEEISECLIGNFYWKDKDGIYLGCNKSALDIPGKGQEDVIGKTDYDLWPDRADQLRENDLAVMRSGKLLSFEEVVQIGDEIKYYAVIKVPMRNAAGSVVGIIGNSLDITRQKEAGSLKSKIKEQERFKILSEQLIHDIRTPLLVLSNILKLCKNLTEKEHIMLRDSITSIQRIVYGLLGNYDKEKNTLLHSDLNCQHILVSQALEEIIFHKKCQYDAQSENSKITFQYHIDPSLKFTFIYGNIANFERMMNNFLSNAVEAIGEKKGIVSVGFTSDNDSVRIIIMDNGRGMPPETVDKLMRNESVASTKEGGYGIGTTQIRDTLKEFNGTQFIESKINIGTKFLIVIPRSHDPKWIVKQITFRKGDNVIILDDDVSIHHMWESKLAQYSKDIQLIYFENGQGTIDFIKSFKVKNKLILLSDFELRHQELNGLEVIQDTDMCHRSILVSSVYNNKEIQDSAQSLDIPMLPKAFIDDIKINFEEEYYNVDKVCPDVIIIDDSKIFANSISDFLRSRKIKVDTYYYPNDLLENLSKYGTDIKIIMDNYFNDNMSGKLLAEQLYKRGYKKLYVFTGSLDRDIILQYPKGTKAISKASPNCMDDLLYECRHQ